MEQKSSTSSQFGEIDLLQVAKTLLAKWYVVLLCVGLSVGIAYVYLKLSPFKYRTYSTVLVRSDDASNPLAKLSFGGAADFMSKDKEVEDEMQIIQSKSLIRKMVEELQLQVSTFEKQNWSYRERFGDEAVQLVLPTSTYNKIRGRLQVDIHKKSADDYVVKAIYTHGKNKEEYKFQAKTLNRVFSTDLGDFSFLEQSNAKASYKYRFKAVPVKSLVEFYTSSLQVTLASKKSNAVVISCIGENTTKNEAIVNKMVDLYNRDALLDKNKMSLQMADFINERLQLISKELGTVETEVELYRRKHNIADITSQTKLFVETAGEYEKMIAEIETQYSLVSFVENYLSKEENKLDMIPGNIGIEDEALTLIIAQYNEQVLEYLRLTRSTNINNPIVAQMLSRIQLTRGNILKTISNVKEGLTITRNDLNRKNSQFTSKITQVPTIEREFYDISRQQQIKQQLYLFLLQKREETQLDLASATTSAKIIDAAYTEDSPVSPRRMIIFLMAIVIGGIVSVVIIYAYELMHDEIKQKSDVERISSLPIIGKLPYIKGIDPVVMKEGVRNNTMSEMFRLIRTNLKFVLRKPDSKVMLVTSSVGGEGKSFFAINIALSLAMLKKRTVLVGLDIRKPTLSAYMKVKSQLGVTAYLSDSSVSLDDVVVRSKTSDFLDVIYAGAIPPNPSELVNSDRIELLFKQLRETYDYIVVDTAPVGLVSDTMTLNSYSDAVLYVCRLGVSPKQQLKALNGLIAEEKLNNVSLIINGVSNKEVAGYGSYISKKVEQN